jgi:hypothetical protein
MSKVDANDVLQAKGEEGLREAVDGALANGADALAPHASNPAKPLPLTLYDELGREARKTMLVERLLGAGEASSMYGEPGSGKSVLAEDLGLHIAAKRPWFGRTVLPGAVLYLALERAALVKRRAIAFRIHTGLLGLPFAIFGGELDFRDAQSAATIVATAKTLEDKAAQPLRLVILDTISRSLCGGDENSSKDMGNTVRTISRILELTQAHVLTVHHSPVGSGERQRGHSSLKGALDTTILVEQSGTVRAARVTKANDSAEDEAVCFALESVEIDRDEAGNVTAAPIVIAAQSNAQSRPVPTRKLSDKQRLALDALARCCADRGQPAPPHFALPGSIMCVPTSAWRDELFAAGVLERSGNPREEFKRLKLGLQARHLTAEREDLAWRI